MAIIKCKMCGGDLALVKGSTIATCEFCGSQQTVPAIDDDKKARLFNRANQYRMDSEFDKAYSVYESIANDEPENAEAYWGMLLSEYGVEYVDDPKTGKKTPTCHRTLVRSVTSSPNYKSACQYADADSRIMYEDDATVLDVLQKRVLNASAKEEPYDVFICYKESDENGNRTPDSVLAQDIYDALTSKGMRVFFSRISLEDKLGQDYEPCIFAALNSAKVMLMVTTDSDHCQSVWVKNEWKRYLDFMKTDPSKTLIPVYKGISPYTLPDEFSKLQSQDMGKLGAIQDLVRGVEKLAGKNQKAAAAGMTKEEKSYVASLEKGQKRTRALLLGVLFAAVSAVASFGTILLGEDGFFDIMFYRADGGIVAFTGSPAALLPLFIYPLHGIGPALNCTYGRKSKGAHWTYLILYALGAALLSFFGSMGFHPGFILLLPQVFNGAAALITAITAYRQKKTALIVHCIFIAALLAVLLANTFL